MASTSSPRSAQVRRPAKPKGKTDQVLKMKDLCTQTGLGRQAIHFYIQQGLIPEGKKTGRNMAYYGPAHVERLRLIRRLQEEQFLPLKAIRAVLDMYDEGAGFSPAQRRFIDAVKQQLRPSMGLGDSRRTTVAVAPLLERLAFDRADFDDLVGLGLVALAKSDGVELMREGDVWLCELYAELRRIGFTRALGFTARDLLIVDEATTTLFRHETAILSQRLGHLDAAVAASLVERALPHLNTLLVRLHEAKIHNFIAAL